MKKWLSGGIAALVLGGCSLQTTEPAVAQYRIAPVSVAAFSPSPSCSRQTLRLSLTLAPDLFKSTRIYYADGDLRQYVYTRSRWAESPDRQLRHLFESALAQSRLYQSVITYDSEAYNDLLLELKLNNFMQYFGEDGASSVSVDMELTLMDQESNRVLSTLHLNKTLPTSSNDAEGAVKAFNAIIHQGIAETTGWLDDVCQRESLPEKG